MIGIFDSGVGGLSVLRVIRERLPAQAVLYLADQAHVPYGPRPMEEVYAFSEAITRYLLGQGARLIVVACNTASAAALYPLRAAFPDIPFVGMEPAVKPAAEVTHSGVVGVLATPATFQGALYASVVERFASGVTVLQDVCPGLVGRIEAGDLDGPQTRAILEKALRPMLARGMDTVVMGCTHYPFVIPVIQDLRSRRACNRPRPGGSPPDCPCTGRKRAAQPAWCGCARDSLFDYRPSRAIQGPPGMSARRQQPAVR
jgi:glutamate racemase